MMSVNSRPLPVSQWHDPKVHIAGTKVAGYLDGKLYLEHCRRRASDLLIYITTSMSVGAFRHIGKDRHYPRIRTSSATVRFVSMPHVVHTYRISTRRSVTKVRSCAPMGR